MRQRQERQQRREAEYQMSRVSMEFQAADVPPIPPPRRKRAKSRDGSSHQRSQSTSRLASGLDSRSSYYAQRDASTFNYFNGGESTLRRFSSEIIPSSLRHPPSSRSQTPAHHYPSSVTEGDVGPYTPGVPARSDSTSPPPLVHPRTIYGVPQPHTYFLPQGYVQATPEYGPVAAGATGPMYLYPVHVAQPAQMAVPTMGYQTMEADFGASTAAGLRPSQGSAFMAHRPSPQPRSGSSSPPYFKPIDPTQSQQSSFEVNEDVERPPQASTPRPSYQQQQQQLSQQQGIA